MNTFKLLCAILAFSNATQEITEIPGEISVTVSNLPQSIGAAIEEDKIGISIAALESPVKIGGALEPPPLPPILQERSIASPNQVLIICMNFYKFLTGAMIGVMLVLINLSFGKVQFQQPTIFLLFMAFLCVSTISIQFLWNCFCKNCRIGGCPLTIGTVIGITLMVTDWSPSSIDLDICFLLVGCVYISVILALVCHCFSNRTSA